MEGLLRSIGNFGCADKIASNMCPTLSRGGKEEDAIQNKGENE
jgi:hypothetical protein